LHTVLLLAAAAAASAAAAAAAAADCAIVLLGFEVAITFGASLMCFFSIAVLPNF